MDIRSEIEKWHPNIVGKPFKIIESSNLFNCIAFTLDIYDDYLWTNEASWPKQIPRNLGLDSFRMLYDLHGYEECDSPLFEDGYDKIAFYSKGKTPQHAAKQFRSMWRSKLGGKVIIEHELDWLGGDSDDAYGDIAFIMKRKI